MHWPINIAWQTVLTFPLHNKRSWHLQYISHSFNLIIRKWISNLKFVYKFKIISDLGWHSVVTSLTRWTGAAQSSSYDFTKTPSGRGELRAICCQHFRQVGRNDGIGLFHWTFLIIGIWCQSRLYLSLVWYWTILPISFKAIHCINSSAVLSCAIFIDHCYNQDDSKLKFPVY